MSNIIQLGKYYVVKDNISYFFHKEIEGGVMVLYIRMIGQEKNISITDDDKSLLKELKDGLK